MGAFLIERLFDRWERRRGRAETDPHTARLQALVGVARVLAGHKARIVRDQAAPIVRDQRLGQPAEAPPKAVQREFGAINAFPTIAIKTWTLSHIRL